MAFHILDVMILVGDYLTPTYRAIFSMVSKTTSMITSSRSVRLRELAKDGFISTTEHFLRLGYHPSKKIIPAATKNCSVEALEKLRLLSCPWTSEVYRAAAWYGRIDIIDHVRENGYPQTSVASKAVRNGQLETLKHLGEVLTMPLCFYAIVEGRLDILKYLLSENTPLSNRAVGLAVANHRDDILDYLLSLGFTPTTTAFESAVMRKDIAILDRLFLYARPPDNLISTAIDVNSLRVLKHLMLWGLVPNTSACINAVNAGSLEILEFLLTLDGQSLASITCEGAARGGNLALLRYLREHGCEWGWDPMTEAAKGNHIDVIKYLRDEGCEWNAWTTAMAASYGYLELLKYLHQNGCEWDSDSCWYAVEYGNIETLKYLRESGCDWDASKLLITAAKRRDLEILEYLRSEGVSWDSTTMAEAVDRGDYFLVKFLHKEGCEWDERATKTAIDKGFLVIYDYLVTNADLEAHAGKRKALRHPPDPVQEDSSDEGESPWD